MFSACNEFYINFYVHVFTFGFYFTLTDVHINTICQICFLFVWFVYQIIIKKDTFKSFFSHRIYIQLILFFITFYTLARLHRVGWCLCVQNNGDMNLNTKNDIENFLVISVDGIAGTLLDTCVPYPFCKKCEKCWKKIKTALHSQD